MLLAVRPGSEVLIPEEYRAQFAAHGYRFVDAPSGYFDVEVPTALADACKRAKPIEVEALPPVGLVEVGHFARTPRRKGR